MNELSNKDMKWIADQASEKKMITVEMVTDWYDEVAKELKLIGLDKSLGGEESEGFIGMIKGGVIGKIQANIVVEPTEFELMILGPYPERTFNKKPSVEMVAFARMNNNLPEISIVSARKDFVHVKNDIELLGSYKTGFSFFEEDRIDDPNTFKLHVQRATEFSMATRTYFMGTTYDEKLEIIKNSVPSVALGDIEHNVSRLRKSKTGKTFPDSMDLKKVTVMVVGTADGVDKNRREWAMLHVVDGTFKPTINERYIAVWVDPSIYNRIQAGPGSLLDIYGIIQKNYEGQISINACFVNPIHIETLEHKNRQAQTDQQPGGTVQVPNEPSIKVIMHNAGM